MSRTCRESGDQQHGGCYLSALGLENPLCYTLKVNQRQLTTRQTGLPALRARVAR